MDPRYRGHIPQDSPRISHAIYPSCYFSADQAHGAALMDPEHRRLQHGYIRNDYTHNLNHHHSHSHPQDLHEVLQREIEKGRIREEIIMSEIVRRRALEAEVRRELMMESEMALQRGSYCSPPAMRLESPMRSLLGTRAARWSAEERLGMALEEKGEQEGRYENGGLDSSLYQRRSADLRISDVRPPSEGNNKKERILLLTNSDENISGSKRKAVTSLEELPADIIDKKKAKEEWSCALCQVSATSEKALEEHLLGKKHRSKEIALIAQRGGKNYSIGLYSSKATKSNHVVATIDPGEEEKVNYKAQPLLSEKEGEATTKEDDVLLLGNPKLECSNGTQSEVIQRVQKNEDDSKKKVYKHWCDICHVGTLSSKVMNSHKMGKKHRSRLRSCEQNGRAGSINQMESAAVVDCVQEASENGKDINTEKFKQVLDQASTEDHILLNTFDHREQGGGTFDSENINKALHEKWSEAHKFLDAVVEEDHKH